MKVPVAKAKERVGLSPGTELPSGFVKIEEPETAPGTSVAEMMQLGGRWSLYPYCKDGFGILMHHLVAVYPGDNIMWAARICDITRSGHLGGGGR